MGAWGYGIMDGDDPLDTKDALCRKDEDCPTSGRQYFDEPRMDRLTDTKFMEGFIDGDNAGVVAFIMIENRVPLSDEIRRRAISCLQSDIDYVSNGNPTGWKDPEERIKKLTEFREIVKAITEAEKALMEFNYDG